jgi:hypothetical protein
MKKEPCQERSAERELEQPSGTKKQKRRGPPTFPWAVDERRCAEYRNTGCYAERKR